MRRLAFAGLAFGLLLASQAAPALAAASQEQALSIGASCPGSAQTPNYGFVQVTADTAGRICTSPSAGQVYGAAATVTTTITRPADTTAYAANDAFADSTSAPTSGGFTLTGAARASGGSGIITDLVVVSSNDPATTLQGEVWIFDSSVTAVNDNAAFALSDGDAVKLVGVVPFTLLTTTAGSGTNAYAQVSNLAMGFAASGTANLRFLVKVKNAYTPASGEQLTVRAKIVQVN